MLTEHQQTSLEKSIYEYLTAKGYSTTADSFLQECPSLASVPPPAPDIKGGTEAIGGVSLLEKKWVSVVRLQKKVLELEASVGKAGGGLNGGGKASGGKDGNSAGRLLPSPDMLPATLLGHRGQGIAALCLHPHHTTLVSGGEDSTIKLWDTSTSTLEKTLTGHTACVNGLDYDSKGEKLVSCSNDMTIKIWALVHDYTCIKTLRGHDHVISDVKFINNSESIVSCSRDTTVKVWSSATGFVVHTSTEATAWVRALAVTVAGDKIAAGGNSNDVVVYRVEGMKEICTLRGHEHVVESVAFPSKAVKAGESESMVVTGSRDKTVKVWNINTAACVHTFTDHDNWVRSVVIHPSNNYIISVSDDKSMKVFDVANKRCLRSVEDAHGHFVTKVVFGEGLKCVVTAGVDNKVKVWPCR
jgi:platelet-activating factor acetylhydrolase IB subunit alpha